MTDSSRRVALRTVLTAIFGVVGLIVVVYALTGRFSDEPPPSLRRASYAAGGPAQTSMLLRVQVDGRYVPFFLVAPEEGPGVLVNGIEELPIRVRRGKPGTLTVEVARYAAELRLTVEKNLDVTGTWVAPGLEPAPLDGSRVADILPERRFPERPDEPEARGEQADYSHVWQLDVGGRLGKAVFRQSDTGVVSGTLALPEGDLGHLAGRVFGRRLLLSRFDGRHAVRVELTMLPGGEGFTGTVYRRGAPALALSGKAASRVALASPLVAAGDGRAPVAGPALVALLPLTERLSHELVPTLTEWQAIEGLTVVAVPLAPPEQRTVLVRAFREAHAPGFDLMDPWPEARATRPTLWLVDRGGQVVARADALVGPALPHDFNEQTRAITARARELLSP